ncbi:MAG TPA: phosphoribosylanthranilate isomerase [Solirubrobacteraceae bacterium]|nr:phosphoribosylanthranilate isomerase [Solirubrobacteraceae bacterium]
MSETRVKICGVTDVADAELAAELGAWAVGMVFYEPSPRRCSVEQAQRIAAALDRREIELCGVFVNATFEEIEHHVQDLGLSLIQLHGDEGPTFCVEAARRTGTKAIKAIQIAGAGDVRQLGRYHVDFHLADAKARSREAKRLRGGTGETFDWELLAGRRSGTPLILSGGLGAENVGEAIARVRPFAVDSASGTERAPGHKDEAKLRAFFRAVASSGEPAESDAAAIPA